MLAEILQMVYLLTEPGLAGFLGPPLAHFLEHFFCLGHTTSFFCDASETSRINKIKVFLENSFIFFSKFMHSLQ